MNEDWDNRELDAVDRCCNWVRDLMLVQKPPGIMAAVAFDDVCRDWETVWGKAVIADALARLGECSDHHHPALLERGPAGEYIMPYMRHLDEAGML